MKLGDVLALISAPVGQTSAIVALLPGGDPKSIGHEKADVTTALEAAKVKLTVAIEAQRTCGSDAAHWGYQGQISYWVAVCFILQAAELVGPDNLPNIPPPELEGRALMDTCAELERYGKLLLDHAKGMVSAGEANPGTAPTVVAISMDNGELRKLAQPVYDLLREQIGEEPDQQLALQSCAAALYAVGCVMAQMGILLAPETSLAIGVPSLVDGYHKATLLAQRNRAAKAH